MIYETHEYETNEFMKLMSKNTRKENILRLYME